MEQPPTVMYEFLSSLAHHSGVSATPNELAVIQAYAMNPWLPADYFREANFINIPAGAGMTIVVGLAVPQGMLGILDSFANATSDPQDFDTLIWQVRVGGAAIQGYDEIQGPMGSLPIGASLFWPLFSNQRVEVVVRNPGVTDITNATAMLEGRFFPAEVPLGLTVPGFEPARTGE